VRNALAPLFTVLQATLQGWGLLLLLPLFWTPVTRWRREPGLGRRIAWLAAVPSPWILLAYWTSFHWRADPSQPLPVSESAERMAIGTLAATLAIAVASLVFNRDTRGFFTGWGLANGWFAAIGALLCIMATSGNWI
jgi:hypothetical protein